MIVRGHEVENRNSLEHNFGGIETPRGIYSNLRLGLFEDKLEGSSSCQVYELHEVE